MSQTETERAVKGRTIARGVAFGHVHVDALSTAHLDSRPVADGQVAAETERLRTAISNVHSHLEEYVRASHDAADEDLHQVVAAHQLILDDSHFVEEVVAGIEARRMRAEVAVEEAFRHAADRLSATRDPYLRTRAEDVREISRLILGFLVHGAEAFTPVTPANDEVVFVSRHLHVSGVLRARNAGARGFVTCSRAFSSHGAILLRASGIPSVGGVDIDLLPPGAPVMVDGLQGEVIVHPSEATRTRIHQVGKEAASRRANRKLPAKPAVTADGTEVRLWANIDMPPQIELCGDYRLHGIGLLRTEFLVLSSGRPPDEAEQRAVYTQVAKQLRGRPFVIRTFDIGADKVADGLIEDNGGNPALGLRGLRRHLWRHPAEFRTQLRAVLRATKNCTAAAVLFPMVTHEKDVTMAREHLDAVRAELDAHGVPYNRKLLVGAMVEVPAAALSVADILKTVDFVSIGTNDLSQYLGAADRNNATVAQYLAPEASGLFTALEWMIRAAREIGRAKDLMVCGELASEPESAARMVELGYTSLTVVPMASPGVRDAIAEVRCSSAV